MNNTKWKLILGGTVIVAVLAWLAFSGFEESNTYYKTVEELLTMKERAVGLRLRVAGDLVPGSVQRNGEEILFRLKQKDRIVSVRYIGQAILPDNFQEGSQAICEGSMTPEGLFVAKKVQAKCASKYEAAPVSGAVEKGGNS